jgi:hypothetical protein
MSAVEKNLPRLRELLLQHRNLVESEYYFPGLEKSNPSAGDANAFLLGAVMDYQMDADLVWDNAEELANMLGSENLWRKIADMSEEQLLGLRKADGTHFHRYWEAEGNRSIAKRMRRIATNMVNRFHGDSRNIWNGRTADEVYNILKHEVRVNLSNSDATMDMIVMALLKYGHIKGTGDVKTDMHVKRVLSRITNVELDSREVKLLARRIYPDSPWELDIALYDIGKKYCRPQWPYCDDCPMISECLTARLG